MRRALVFAAVLAGVVALAGCQMFLPRATGNVAPAPIGYPTGWIPQGVQTIDVRDPTTEVLVDDPAKVARIIGMFDALERPGNGPGYGCAGGDAANVTFTFRAANGHVLAMANSTPGLAWPCDPVHLTVRTDSTVFLVDGFTVGVEPPFHFKRGASFIGRVEQLLGVKFHTIVYYG